MAAAATAARPATTPARAKPRTNILTPTCQGGEATGPAQACGPTRFGRRLRQRKRWPTQCSSGVGGAAWPWPRPSPTSAETSCEALIHTWPNNADNKNTASLSLCLSLCPSLPLSVSLSLSPSLGLSPSLCLSLCLSHSLCLSVSLSLSLSLCLIPRIIELPVSLSPSLCLSVRVHVRVHAHVLVCSLSSLCDGGYCDALTAPSQCSAHRRLCGASPPLASQLSQRTRAQQLAALATDLQLSPRTRSSRHGHTHLSQ